MRWPCLLVGYRDGRIALWDMKHGQRIYERRSRVSPITDVQFTKSGKYGMFGVKDIDSTSPLNDHTTVHQLSFNGHQYLSEPGVGVIHPQGFPPRPIGFPRFPAIFLQHRFEARLWQPHSPDGLYFELAHTESGTRYDHRLLPAEFTPGDQILVGSTLRDIADGKVVHRLIDEWREKITAVAASPRGELLATGQGFPSGTLELGKVTLYEVATGKVLQQYHRYHEQARFAQFSSDGRRALVSFVKDNCLWDLESGKILRKFNHGGLGVIHPDGDKAVFYSNSRNAPLVDIETGEKVGEVKLPDHFGDINGSYVISGGTNLARYDVRNKVLVREDGGSLAMVKAFSGERVGKVSGWLQALASWSGQRGLSMERHRGAGERIAVWDLDGKKLATHSLPDGQLLAISPDGKSFLYADRSNREPDSTPGDLFQLYETDTGKLVRSLGRHAGSFRAEFSPDGRRIVLVPHFSTKSDWTPLMKIIDAATGDLISEIKTGPWHLPEVTFSDDGSRLLVAASNRFDSTQGYEWRQMEQRDEPPQKVVETKKLMRNWPAVRIWDAGKGKQLHVLRRHRHPVEQLHFDPTGLRLISISRETINLWDAATGENLLSLDRQSHFSVVEVNPECSRMAVAYSVYDRDAPGNNRRFVEVWNLESRTLTDKLRPDEMPKAMLLLDETKLMLFGSRDATKWIVESGRAARKVASFDYDSDLKSARLRPGAQHFVTLHYDGSARFWDRKHFTEQIRFLYFENARNWIAIRPDGVFADGTPGGSAGVAEILNWYVDDRLVNRADIFEAQHDSKAMQVLDSD